MTPIEKFAALATEGVEIKAHALSVNSTFC